MSRKNICCFVLPVLLLLLLVVGAANTYYGQDSLPRDFSVADNTVPKEVYEITKVTNVQAPEFPKGFKVEVKNVSNKPICYLHLVLVFPRSKGLYPSQLVLPIEWGNTSLINPGTFANPSDPSLKPGETIVVEPNPERADDLYKDLALLHESENGCG